jgi:hypothetical protein
MNDAHDNARTDRAILEQVEAGWAEERALKEAAGPNVGLTDCICRACKGTGGGPPSFEWDEHNPEGWWEYDPCEICCGSGLATNINDLLETGRKNQERLARADALLTTLHTKLGAWRTVVYSLTNRQVERIDGIRAFLEGEFNELLAKLNPEPKED